MQKTTRSAAVVFAVFSAAIVWGSWNLEYYTTLGPGPGFFPFWLGAVLGLLSLVWLFQMRRTTETSKDAAFFPERWGIVRILSIVAALALMAFLMDFIGFQSAMFLFVIFMLTVLGKQSPWLTLIIALLCSVGVYHVFGQYLDVTLPASSVAFLAKLGL